MEIRWKRANPKRGGSPWARVTRLCTFVIVWGCAPEPASTSKLLLSNTDGAELGFVFEGQHLQWSLRKSSLLSSGFKVTQVGHKSVIQTAVQGAFYEGVMDARPGAWVRVHVLDGVVEGTFMLEQKRYTVEGVLGAALTVRPLTDFDEAEAGHCRVVGEGPEFSAAVSSPKPSSALVAPPNPRLIELVLIADYEYFQKAGSQAATQILSTLNQVDGIYRETFQTGFVVTDLVVFETAEDPFTALGADDMIFELADYRDRTYPQAGAVHLFTGRRLGGATVGVAFVGALCEPFNVGISEENLVTLVAHEIGHNFGARHDREAGCGGGFIMDANVSPSTEFSSCSQSAVGAFISRKEACFLHGPTMVSPSPGQALLGRTQAFSWTDNGRGVTNWALRIGSEKGARDLFASPALGPVSTVTVDDLPLDGRDLYVRLRYRLNGFWKNADFVYQAFAPEVQRIVPTSAQVFRGRVCDEDGVLAEGGGAAGLGYRTLDGFDVIDGQNVTACMQVNFETAIPRSLLQLRVRSAKTACGASCVPGSCEDPSVKVFYSRDGRAFFSLGSLDVSPDFSEHLLFVEPEARNFLVCRGREGSARKHVEVDAVSLAPRGIQAVGAEGAWGRVCDGVGALSLGGLEAKLGYQTADGSRQVDGQNVTACLLLDFGTLPSALGLTVVARSIGEACGASCRPGFCGTGGSFKAFSSLDGQSFTYLTELDTTPRPTWYQVPLGGGPLRFALICRGRAGSARDHVALDHVEVVLKEGL